jgi:hypothetical protein
MLSDDLTVTWGWRFGAAKLLPASTTPLTKRVPQKQQVSPYATVTNLKSS